MATFCDPVNKKCNYSVVVVGVSGNPFIDVSDEYRRQLVDIKPAEQTQQLFITPPFRGCPIRQQPQLNSY